MYDVLLMIAFWYNFFYYLQHDQLKLRPCFLPESQKIDGTEYLRESTDLAIFFYILLNLEAWNLAGLYKIENN